MWCPSENLLSSVLTFHSISLGGFLDPPPKYMSYSTFSRRSWSSSKFNSSSIAKVAAPFPSQLACGHPKKGSVSAEYTIAGWGLDTSSKYRDFNALSLQAEPAVSSLAAPQ